MATYVATTVGLFPLPDPTKRALSRLKGHQKGDLVDGHESDAVTATYAEARAEVIATQVEAGLDRVVEGQLRWDDMLAHPLAVNDAVETHGLVRYYDNNNFYRDPVVVDSLAPTGDVAAELSAAADVAEPPLQAVLPGPYTLGALARDASYGDAAEFLAAIGRLLAGEVERFPDLEHLVLLEPSLVTDPPSADDQPAVGAAIDAVAGAFPGDVAVHTYWGAPDERTHATLLDAAIEAIGYDLVTAPAAAAELVAEQGTLDDVVLGVVDGQNTLVETTAAVRERVDRFESALPAGGPDTVCLSPNTELFYLPVATFEAKLGVLGEAVAPGVIA